MGKLTRFNNVHYIHFVTTDTYSNKRYFTNPKNCLIVLKAIKRARRELGFKLKGYVIMPDHLHILIEPPLNEKTNISEIMMRIKGYAARLINLAAVKSEAEASAKRDADVNPLQLGKDLASEPSANRNDDTPSVRLGEGLASPTINVWQKSFWNFPVYSEKVFEQKLNYTHNNPLRAGLVKNLDDYIYSSYQNYYFNNNSLINIDF